MGPVSIGVEVQRNTDGDTPSSTECLEGNKHGTAHLAVGFSVVMENQAT